MKLLTFCIFILSIQSSLARLEKMEAFNHIPLKKLPQMREIDSKKKIYYGKIEHLDQDRKALNIEMYYYKSKVRNAPLVILLPPIRSMTIVDRLIAEHFQKKGYNAIISILPDTLTDPNRPLKEIDKVFSRGVQSVSTIIDYANLNPYIDGTKVAIHGISLGAILGSLAISVEKRVKGGITWLAGGNLPKIISESVNDIVTNYREVRMKREGVRSLKELKKYLKKNIKLDPLNFANKSFKNKVFSFISQQDNKVMTSTQYELWRKFGRPKSYQLLLGHRPAILNFWMFYYLMDAHLSKIFKL